MHSERRILINTAIFTSGELLGQLANFMFVALFARAFGVNVMAHYSLGMAVGGLLAILVDFGTAGFLTRESARNPRRARELVGLLLPTQAPLALLLWGLSIGISAWLLDLRAGLLVLASACGYQLLSRLSLLLFAPFVGTEKIGGAALAGAVHRFVTLALGALAIFYGCGPQLASCALLAGGVLLFVWALVLFVRGFGVPHWRVAPIAAFALRKEGSAYARLSALNVAIDRGGLIVLSGLAGREAVGLYAIADRIVVAPALLPIMFVNAVYPALLRLANESAERVHALTVRCARLLFVGTIPVATLLTLLAPDIVVLLFGRNFEPAVGALQVLAWTIPMDGVRQLLGVQLLALDQQAAATRVRAFSLGVLIVSCVILILCGFGFKGAACAELISESFAVLWYLLLLRRSQSVAALIRSMLAPLFAAAVTFPAATMFTTRLTLGPRACALAVLILLALLATGSIRLHDLRFLREVLSRPRR
ncbi:MAG: oligosaccharide flippase family protein [Pseudomonadota bacterium]|nr:oligosaccharide flippase family protein [Pseudomonadota bacterium]